MSLFSYNKLVNKLPVKKTAFTLAETILTMMILGILAATMVTVLKPQQYRDQAFDAQKKKLFTELDNVTQTILTECTKDMKLSAIYNNCDVTSYTYSFSTTVNGLYARYMQGTPAGAGQTNGTCPVQQSHSSLKLKNGACVYFGLNSIKVDVNGAEGPNEDNVDRMQLDVGDEGISTDLDQTKDTNWVVTSCTGFTGCRKCTATACLECYSGYSDQAGYYLKTDGKCGLCPTGCSACSGASTCTKCRYNYYLNGTSCKACSSTQACPGGTSQPTSCGTGCTACSYNDDGKTCSTCASGYNRCKDTYDYTYYCTTAACPSSSTSSSGSYGTYYGGSYYGGSYGSYYGGSSG